MPGNLRNLRHAYYLWLASVLIVALGSTVEATTLTRKQLSEVWRETFPLQNEGMAPPSFATSKSVPPSPATGTGVPARSNRPHPAVARIVVPEQGAISYGSGTLIDVRERFGMVITNWHVVRDATDTIEVVFPSGFSSKARALKVDSDWDLAALVIWRPPVEPVAISATAPRPGDELTICGYGPGNYRCATGRCTQYYAPRLDFPRHMVELDVEARQGDSGGPIFNRRGELAGVLFGAGQGTTLGSFGGRVNAFLASLAPDVGRARQSLAANETTNPPVADLTTVNPKESSAETLSQPAARPSATLRPHVAESDQPPGRSQVIGEEPSSPWPDEPWPDQFAEVLPPAQNEAQRPPSTVWQPAGSNNLFEQVKTVLAAVGLVTLVVQALRVAR